MSFDPDQIGKAAHDHGALIRVLIAAASGSTPRDIGTSMLIWPEGQIGTIGGGELELRATDHARAMLKSGTKDAVQKLPLGPALGQCCGGAVTVLYERFDTASITPRPAAKPDATVFARAVGPETAMPLSVKRILDRARAQGARPRPQMLDGWMIEPISKPTAHIWIYGAGHVGRALVSVLSPLPELSITWVDTGPDRFPDNIPENVTALPAPRPETTVALAPPHAHHLVLTYSHALDLELCHRLLTHGFASAGLIGSATKWARFRKRLSDLGHHDDQISEIQCPIGNPDLGKSPQAIAVGVTSALLRVMAMDETTNRGLPIDGGHAPKRRAADT